VHHEAVVAVDPATGQGIGVARHVQDPRTPGDAEIAVTVTDAWQARGVGSILVRYLIPRARAAGVERYVATVLSTNEAVIALLLGLGGRVVARNGATLDFVVDLDRAPG
jgi:GNAT superfamily N-acetyltransferase